MRLFQPALSAAVLALGLMPLAGQTLSPEQQEFFEKRVRPIFATHCQGCHNAKSGTAGLNLTSAAGLRKGADSGPVVVPGDIEKSRLLQVVGYQERLKMPPTGKLSDEEITALREWVKIGAPWPNSGSEATVSAQPVKKKGYTRGQKEFWSLRPLRQVELPAVNDKDWVRSPIDRFILSRLESSQVPPAGPASKLVLIRRATFDLTGLPPAQEDIRAFLADESPDAFEKVVDRLLASPRYGERWGRHWLDVARYADSTGADEDYRYPHAWRYRDYVINAFNQDIPFDRFIREQIAGDLLPPPAGQSVNIDGIVATGFLALGPKLVAEQDKVKMFYDIVDEQIEVTSKAFLGLSIACARCHDHKFDPISTKDYYSLASIFASTKQLSKLEGTVSQLYFAPLVSKEIAGQYEVHQKKIADKEKEIAAVSAAEGRRYRDELAPRMAEYMIAARSIYESAADTKAVAKELSLDEAVLQRWANYLKPTKERRVHLEAWYKAPPSEAQTVAKQYQDDFIAVAAYRQKAQDEWKVKADSARARGEQVPAAPKFMPGDNRFYTEVGGAKGPLGLPEKEPETVFSEAARAKWTALKAELKTIKDAGPPEPPLACGVAEGESVEQRVFLRGNPESRGEPVAKAFPAILAGEKQPPIEHGSGRRELAEWLASPANPLPARVMVNRIWQGHFGEGIVRTPNNFGIVGERPTHPELLDWLAGEFIAQGWSVKKMHRLIMLSNAYRMSSEVTAEKSEKDPENRLLSRFTMRRMTVEEVRDSLLQLDGSLDLTMGGTLQKGQGTDNEFSDGRKSLHPDDSKRRTVYLPLRRSNLATLLTLFDFGDATTSNELRSQTNVAPQALFMMNSKFVAERSQSLAKRLLEGDTADDRRVSRAWFTVLGREPSREETEAGLEYVRRFLSKSSDDGARLLAWSSLCRSLIASNDFIYIH
jgi:mono/diheme cytochrome c family protein